MPDDITIDTADGPMPAVLAAPAGVPRGAVLVVQEAFGLTAHIRSICDRLADAGWLAIAPALFHRQGVAVLDYDFSLVMPHLGRLTAEGIGMDLDAVFGELDGRGFPAASSAIVGFCMGGTVALVAATRRRLGAAVTFYGGGVAEGRFGFPALADAAPGLQAPWLGLFGDLDPSIPSDDVEALRVAAATAPVATEVVRYPDAGHGFNNDERTEVFHPPSAEDAWARMLAWFEAHVGDRG